MKLNQYEWNPAEDLIAEGAFAEVFKARDTNNENRYVALKIYKEGISKGTTNTMGNKYTLEKEFRKIDGLSHSNVISFYGLDYITYQDGLGRTLNYPVIIMEYASEGTLLQYIQRHNDPAVVDDLIVQIISGVAYLHKEGTIHRDLKPGNILISLNRRNEPVAKITDFGISRDTIEEQNLEQSVTEGVGTPHYMAPEQFFKKRFGINGEISEETDIWGLGIIIYRMLAGKRPFGHDSKDYELVREMIINEEPDLSLVPEKYRELIKSCLQKNACDRPKNASDLLNKIGVPPNLEEDATVIAPPREELEADVTQMAPPVPASKGGKKKKNLVLPIAIFLVLGVGVAGAFLLSGDEAPSQLAVVQLNQKFGYIDRNGDKAIPFRYDGAWAISEGLGLVQTNGKWEFINEDGEVQIKQQFDDALPFSEGLAAVKMGEEWGFINKEGEFKIKPQYESARAFEEDLAPVMVDDKWGYINQDNEFVIIPQYEAAYSFSEGFAVVRSNGMEGFINPKGTQVIPPRFDLALSFSDGLAAVNLEGKWGFINAAGAMTIDPVYEHTWGFSEGLAPVALDGKWGFINKNGEMVTTVKYDGASGFSNGLAAVRIKDKEGFIDKDEKTVIPFSYQYADAFSEVK